MRTKEKRKILRFPLFFVSIFLIFFSFPWVFSYVEISLLFLGELYTFLTLSLELSKNEDRESQQKLDFAGREDG